MSGEKRRSACFKDAGGLARDRRKVRDVEDRLDRRAQPVEGLAGVGCPDLVPPGHHTIRSDKERSGLLDLANALPLAVEILRPGRSGDDDPQEGQIQPTRPRPARPRRQHP